MKKTYKFSPTVKDGDEFTVVVEDDKLVEASGIGEARARYLMKRGGIEGLIRAKRLTHSVKQMDVGPDGAWGDKQKDDSSAEAVTGDVVKMDREKQIVYGWAYTAFDKSGVLVVDQSGEFVDDPDELEEAAYKYVTKSRKGGADHARTSANQVVQVGELVESMVFTKEKQEALGIPPGVLPQCAWWVGIKVHDAAVWKRYKDGELTSFSIAGKATRKEVP